jgi:glycosyltransferase involved in cell wall biosynthesis
VTIHDLNYLMVPDAHFGLRGLGMRVLVPLAARASHRILADSQATRDDLVARLGVPPGKVDVVALGLGQPAGAIPTPEAALRERLSLGRRPVALSLSAKRPHKNLEGLLDALARIPAERRPVAVLPGYPTPHEAVLRERAARLGVEGDVRFLGWTSPEDVEGLFALAGCFVFPSLYEGFGLPVLEAMARGVPVACSDRSSLPEVAGDAARLFDPSDPASIAAAVEVLLGDPDEAARLVAAGRARAARFTWEATARATLASYERAMRASAPR